jgi:AraC-like DNA-binding protein
MGSMLVRRSVDGQLDAAVLEHVFDQLPDVLFFVLDAEGRYTSANRAFLRRCGLQEGFVGLTPEQVYPKPLGTALCAQDQLVLKNGIEIRDRLELHLYPDCTQGWCLTFKTPLRDVDGAVTGLVGISRDLQRADERDADYAQLSLAIDELQRRHGETVRLEALARSVGLSGERFERLVKRVFYLTPRELLIKTRIETASTLLLETDRPIGDIAFACGYGDHSAFTRQFKATTGVTPAAFRTSRRRAVG